MPHLLLKFALTVFVDNPCSRLCKNSIFDFMCVIIPYYAQKVNAFSSLASQLYKKDAALHRRGLDYAILSLTGEIALE